MGIPFPATSSDCGGINTVASLVLQSCRLDRRTASSLDGRLLAPDPALQSSFERGWNRISQREKGRRTQFGEASKDARAFQGKLQRLGEMLGHLRAVPFGA